MTSWGNLYGGIDPYSLSDWYRYLNCGYLVPAVGGTDKMAADTAVGTVRTYARIAPGEPFTYEAWKDAVRRGETFVTYGPLLEFAVDGQPMGSRIAMPAQRRHGGRDLAGGQRHRAHDARRAGRQRRDPRERGGRARRGERALVGQGGPQRLAGAAGARALRRTSPRSSPRTPRR